MQVLSGRHVSIDIHGQGGPCIFAAKVIQDENGIEQLVNAVAELVENRSYTLVIFEVQNWNAELSPWPAPAAVGEECFAGHGAETLQWLTKNCIPALLLEGIISQSTPLMVAGYSLAGLFALWALYESQLFSGAASCSGSVWLEGFLNYIQSKSVPANSIVYLSLGSKEERTKNSLMSTVGNTTREFSEILKNDSQCRRTTLQWNKGGHFADPTGRLAKGIAWLIQNGQQ